MAGTSHQCLPVSSLARKLHRGTFCCVTLFFFLQLIISSVCFSRFSSQFTGNNPHSTFFNANTILDWSTYGPSSLFL